MLHRTGSTLRANSAKHAGLADWPIEHGLNRSAGGFGQTQDHRRNRRVLRLRTRISKMRIVVRVDCLVEPTTTRLTTRVIQLKSERCQTLFDRAPEAYAETDTRTSRQ